MKLLEIATGASDGILAHTKKAFDNMTKHAKSHPDPKMRDACASAAKCLQFHMSHPTSMYQDPHSFVRLLTHLQDAPDIDRVSGAVSGLGSYSTSEAE